MADHAAYKRKNYLINRHFQLKYTFIIVALLLTVMVATGFGLYMGIWGSVIENFSQFKMSQKLETVKRITDYDTARYNESGDYRLERIFREAELLSAQEKNALKRTLQSANRSLAPKLIMLTVFIFLAGILLSHKIAGPMYRIEKSAIAVQRGDLSVNFKIRRGDEMRNAAGALEDMIKALRADVSKIKAESLAMDEKINSLVLDSVIPAEDSKRLKEILASIDLVLSKYKT